MVHHNTKVGYLVVFYLNLLELTVKRCQSLRSHVYISHNINFALYAEIVGVIIASCFGRYIFKRVYFID